jgi:putative transposase
MDFISGSLDCGRKFRVLNVINDFNREALMVDAGFSFPGTKVARLLEF